MGRRQRIRGALFFLRGFEFEEAVDLGPGTAARGRGDVRGWRRAWARMICCARDGRWRRVLNLRCGEIVERRRNRWHAGDAEDGIKQGAIFGAEASDFNSLLCHFSALTCEFGFECADVRCRDDAPPDFSKIHRELASDFFATKVVRSTALLCAALLENPDQDCGRKESGQKPGDDEGDSPRAEFR